MENETKELIKQVNEVLKKIQSEAMILAESADHFNFYQDLPRKYRIFSAIQKCCDNLGILKEEIELIKVKDEGYETARNNLRNLYNRTEEPQVEKVVEVKTVKKEIVKVVEDDPIEETEELVTVKNEAKKRGRKPKNE